jgi:hypothetical protein
MTKPAKLTRPWEKYRGQPGDLSYKLLQPGWAGHVEPEELAFIMAHLEQDAPLGLWWGTKPSWKSIPQAAVERVAMEGSEDDQALNRRLARPRQQSRAVA